VSTPYKPILISIVRTVIMPLVAGGLLQLIILAGVNDPSLELQTALASLLAMAWYLLARFLETKNRNWGFMLGLAVTPDYGPDSDDMVLTSVKRTVVPLLVGWVLTVLAEAGFDLDAEAATLALQALITSGYYGIIRFIESSKPQAGVLIGGEASPLY